jgi:hypothetical protein
MAEFTVVSRDVEYVPEWESNRDAAKPIRATLRYLTAAERSQCISGRQVSGDIAVAIDYGKAVRYALKKLDDFVVNKEKVETAAQLMDLSGFDGLFMEIASKIWAMNAREDARPLP